MAGIQLLVDSLKKLYLPALKEKKKPPQQRNLVIYFRAPNKNCPQRRLMVRTSYSIYNNPGLILELSQPSKLIGKESFFFCAFSRL